MEERVPYFLTSFGLLVDVHGFLCLLLDAILVVLALATVFLTALMAAGRVMANDVIVVVHVAGRVMANDVIVVVHGDLNIWFRTVLFSAAAVAKLAAAEIITAITKGIKFTPKLSAAAIAMGKIRTAAALAVMMLVKTIVIP